MSFLRKIAYHCGFALSPEVAPVQYQKLGNTTVKVTYTGSADIYCHEGKHFALYLMPGAGYVHELLIKHSKRTGMVAIADNGYGDIIIADAHSTLDEIKHCRASLPELAIARWEEVLAAREKASSPEANPTANEGQHVARSQSPTPSSDIRRI